MLVVACCVGGVTHWVSSEHGLVVPKVVQLFILLSFLYSSLSFRQTSKEMCVFLYHLLLPIVVFPVTVRNRDFDMDSLL